MPDLGTPVVEPNNRGWVPPGSNVWKAAGSQLFFKPLDVYLKPSDLFAKWNRQLLFSFGRLLFTSLKNIQCTRKQLPLPVRNLVWVNLIF